jgi:hypothetical protein
MSRFDDDLRRAASQLAREPLPPHVLDEALDVPPRRPRWASVAVAVAASAILVVAAGIGVGRFTPPPSPSASPSPSSQASPSDELAGSCEQVRPPAGGQDVVLVFFPCGRPDFDLSSGARSVDATLPIEERLEFALRALLDGPTQLEAQVGMEDVVPASSSELLDAVSVAPDGLADVNFAPALLQINNLSTGAAGGAFLRAVRETGLQFEEVTALELRVDGSCDAFFTLFQGTCQHLAEPVEPFTDCPILPPAELPSGAFITAPRPYPGEPMVSWGSGTDTVTELPGHRSGGPEPPADGTPVAVRGFPGYVIPVGDVPGSQVQIGWEEHGCRYVIWIAPEDGVDAAIDYAARFGGEVGPAPTAAPPLPVTASVEEDQIRVTITLDRSQSVFGQRVWAEVSVENIGADVVHWGHSGTCDWVAGITVVPAFEVPPAPYGRDDWTGDAEILKRLAVDDRGSGTQHFTPEPWVDFEGNFGCTSDIVADTIAPGERLTHRAAWDTMAAHGAPPVPGEYAATATFSYLNRGPAPVDDGGDLARIDVTVLLDVDGSPLVHLSAGEALDAIFEDAAYQQHLAEAPRERWLSHELAYEEGTWTFTLYLRGEDREIEVVERLIASVDASSGVVLDVRVEPGGDVPS